MIAFRDDNDAFEPAHFYKLSGLTLDECQQLTVELADQANKYDDAATAIAISGRSASLDATAAKTASIGTISQISDSENAPEYTFVSFEPKCFYGPDAA